MDKMGWKVVYRNGDGALESATAVGCWIRAYATGERTVGFNDTPVLAFRTRQAARGFQRQFTLKAKVHIFRAQLENPHPQEHVAICNPHKFKGFWDGKPDFAVDAPDGTLACDAITLLEPA